MLVVANSLAKLQCLTSFVWRQNLVKTDLVSGDSTCCEFYSATHVPYELQPSFVVDQEVFRLCYNCESLQCKAMCFGHGLWKGCVFFYKDSMCLCTSMINRALQHV